MQKKYYLSFLVISLIANILVAQNFTYPSIKIEDVSFTGKNLTIQKDDGTGSYITPQWTSKATIQSPVAYVSGIAPKVKASFTFKCDNSTPPTSVYIRGKASDSIDFPSTKVDLVTSSGNAYTFKYPETEGSHVFKTEVVRYFNPFIIKWEVSFDNGTNWNTIGETENTLYVTFKTPQAETNLFKWFHTVFDLSCRNAKQMNTEKTIIAGIWNEFTDQVVLNYNGDSLFYYKKINTTNQTLALLLKYKDAQCYTFAQLFLGAIKIQGIVRTNNYVYIAGKSKSACGGNIDRMLVNKWRFGTPSGGGACSAFPYKTVYNLSNLKTSGIAYKFISTDIKDEEGTLGSCTKNPASFFGNHQIALVDGVYYDASYGLSFPNLTELRDKEIAAWGIGTYQGLDQVTAYFTNDLTKTEMGESITTY